MPTTFIQFRADEDLKERATQICELLGIDLPTYFRMCLSRLVLNNGIPFEMTVPVEKSKGLQALYIMDEISKQNGNQNMTLEEINTEIKKTR